MVKLLLSYDQKFYRVFPRSHHPPCDPDSMSHGKFRSPSTPSPALDLLILMKWERRAGSEEVEAQVQHLMVPELFREGGRGERPKAERSEVGGRAERPESLSAVSDSAFLVGGCGVGVGIH